jgi:hypothetical protein
MMNTRRLHVPVAKVEGYQLYLPSLNLEVSYYGDVYS